MNCLITGRTGFIAQHLIRKLQLDGHNVMGTGCLIKDYSAGKIDAVIHLAAQAGIRPKHQKAIAQYEANVLQTVSFLDLCVKYKVKKFIYISSSSVYGNPVYLPTPEYSDTDRPLCHYAATKKAGELACHTYHHMYGVDVACLRPFTVYGPGQTSNMAIPVFTKLIHEGKQVPVFGNGSIERDYVYVQDVVDGIVGALNVDHGYDEYNIGTGKPLSILSLIGIIAYKLGKPADIKYLFLPNGEAESAYADISKAKNRFGYSPKFCIEDGLDQYIKWYLKEGGKENAV
jgi:UDP-glucuronate 4-epimerase